MRVEGIQSVVRALRARAAAANQDRDASVIVGYTAAYAVYVHEDLTAKHKPGKQAKFLEGPARWLRNELQRIIAENLNRGRTVSQSLLMAGLRLLRESQKIVPVDTGHLKASGFVRLG